MLRQAIATPSRALCSSVRLRTQIPISRPQFYVPAPSVSQRIHPRIAGLARWYSAEADSKQNETADPASNEGADAAKLSTEAQEKAGVPDPLAELKTKLEAKETESRDWKDKYLRSVADFRNLQDRTQRDMKAARDFAIQRFAKDLVDSVDNLDRALAMVPEEKLAAKAVDGEGDKGPEHQQDLANLYEGLKMTETVLMQTLQKHGLERFDPNGEKFNPNEHEATFMTPMDGKEDNTVFHTQQKGFRLNGRILRAAKVGVVKNK